MTLLTAAGCGGSDRHQMTHSSTRRTSVPTSIHAPAQTTTAAQPTGPSIDGCVFAGRHTRLVRFRAPGEWLRAAVVGAGPTGVVLANQSDNSVCEWPPLPSYLAGHGMRVLAFDYGKGDDSAEAQAAARFLHERGARRLVLIGASIGGAVAIDAGIHLRPAPAAVVSLSAVPEATNYPFPADARRLRSPIFQIGSTRDPLTQAARDTRGLFHASPSPAKRLLLIPGAAHGAELIGAGVSAAGQVRSAILAFIRTHTGAAG